jgi:hypothetical protein
VVQVTRQQTVRIPLNWRLADTLAKPPQSNVELIAKKQVLSLKSASRLEQIGDEHSERVQDRNHHFQ